MVAGQLKKQASAWFRSVALVSLGAVVGTTYMPAAVAAPVKKAVKVAKVGKPHKVSAKQNKSTKPTVIPKAKQATRVEAYGKGLVKRKSEAAHQSKATKRTERVTAAKTTRKSAEGKTVGRLNSAQAKVTKVKLGTHRVALSRTKHRIERVASRSIRLGRTAHYAAAPARLSFGQIAGLHDVDDPLDLNSGVAFVMDQDTQQVLYSKNDNAVLPIASLTKLMTGLLIAESGLPLDELITIAPDDVDMVKHSSSRLPVGATLSRGEMLHLALMSSENRAAHALGRTFPGGMRRFVRLMNARAIMLGMSDTRYVEPTGLSSDNRSSARDLAVLVAAAAKNQLVRQFTISQGYEVTVGDRLLRYNNTNRLVLRPDWQINLQKTGYISEAGRCMVMQASVAGRKLIMVFLDSSNSASRLADAERVRNWVEHRLPGTAVAATVDYSG